MRHVAFLRGINVGGRRATGTQLCRPFEDLGFGHVSSFLASGNVVFDTEAVGDLEPRIEATLQAGLGYAVETFVRSAAEVTAVAGTQPFPAEVVAASAGKLQVTFLRSEPEPGSVAAALALGSLEDRLAVVGREWYWLPSGGMSQSSLDLPAVERALGRGTTRTHNTVTRLQARFLSDPAV